MIYAYAITSGIGAPPRARGVHDERPAIVQVDGLQAVYSHHADATAFEPTPDVLWAHEAVVDELLNAGAVLPLRFGTTLADVAVLQRVLRSERERFTGLLERVRGCVELAVRIGLPFDTRANQRSGQEYLAGKLAARRTAEEILAPLEALAADARRRQRGSGPVLTASYLVRVDDIGSFADELRGMKWRHPELTLSCTGPWAPYSFCAEDSA